MHSIDLLARLTRMEHRVWCIPITAAISNSIGQLTQVSNANGTTSYTGFDVMGRVLGSSQLIGPSTFSFNYTYDLAGDLLSETYPTGRTLWNGFDGAGRVNSVRGSTPGGQWTNYVNVGGYWPHGALYYSFYGNNVVPVYAYNNRLQMNDVYASVGGDGNRFLAVWEMNWGGNTNNGNLLATGEYYGDAVPQGQMSSFSQNYGYDSVNRLAWASDNGGWSRNFAYDKTGNGWVTANNGVPLMGNTPTSNVYDNNTNRMNGQGYDAAGNQLNANGDSLSYDAENRLTAATEPVYLGGGTETFVYDGLGQRTEKSSPSETFVYAYDAFGALAVKYAPWNTVLQEYVRMGGQLIATENSGTSPCQTCYFVWDHLGSTRLVTDQNANVVARHDYLPFGEEIPGGWAGRSSEWGATNDTNEKFTGQQRDLETGLDYFHARYLSSSLGRFTSPDPGNAGANPYDPQSWNGYSYARNNPLALVDPSGMSSYGSGSGDDGCDDDASCWDWPPFPPSDPLPTPPPPVITTQEEPVPRGSFPGGETLGLPPGMRLPGPLSAQVLLGLWDWDCSGGVCVPGVAGISNGILGGRPPDAQTLADYEHNLDAIKLLIGRLCSGTTGEKVFKSVRNGAGSGGLRGAVTGTGLVGRSIIGVMEGSESGSIAGPEGAAIGALAGAAVGAASGVTWGFSRAAACKLLGY